MKAECLTEKIKNAISVVERLTGKNLTLPVLRSILWIFKDKNIKLRATNLNLGVEFNIPAKIEGECVLATKGDALVNLFGLLQKDQSIFFENNNDNLLIKTKTSSFNIKTVSYDDFPIIPRVDGFNFYISSQKIIDGFKSVYYSAATTEIKPEIGSVYVYSEEDHLVFVSTDSFRLAEKRIKMKQKIEMDGFLIPYKNVIEIIRVFDGLNDEIKINIQKNQISLETKEIYLTSRIVDGIFPDYKQIIPKQPNTNVVVLKQDLLASLKISNLFADKFNQINFNIKPKQKTFEINSKNVDIGENNTKIESAITGEEVSLSFNYKYILDCFQSISEDSLSLEFSGSNKPMVVKPIGDNSFLYLIMPMNR